MLPLGRGRGCRAARGAAAPRPGSAPRDGALRACPALRQLPHFGLFSPGVDDAESECGLDQGLAFDWTLHNDGDAAALEGQLRAVLRAVQDQL